MFGNVTRIVFIARKN